MALRRIVIVSGPTASGKSERAVELAEQFNGEIISADSVSVYKSFNIGAAKPSVELLGRAVHHLISEFEPEEDFSAGRFREIAEDRISRIFQAGKLPVVVGGTGLYIRALLCGLINDIEERLELETLSQEKLHEKLIQVDPVSAESIHPKDELRTKRALEFFKRTGKTIAEARAEHANAEKRFAALILLLDFSREKLYTRINQRVSEMLTQGLIEETKSLLQLFPKSAKPFSAIGYKHVLEYFEHGDRKVLEEKLARDTRRFAKRQMTWWRNEPGKLNWREIEGTERSFQKNSSEIVASFLERSGEFREDAVFILRMSV